MGNAQADGGRAGDVTTIPGVDPILLQKEEEAWESYEDEDEAIDMSLDTVWAEYDKKGERVISKKVALQFFKARVSGGGRAERD